jgi:hypothetical protein
MTTDDLETMIEQLQKERLLIEEIRDDVLEADALGDTPFSELFHEARTSKENWSKVSAFCDCGGEEVTIEAVDRLLNGEWSPETRQNYDFIISLPVVAFMSTEVARRHIIDELMQALQGKIQSIEHAKRRRDQQTAQ